MRFIYNMPDDKTIQSYRNFISCEFLETNINYGKSVLVVLH